MADQTVPYGRKTQKAAAGQGSPYPLDHRRIELRRRFGVDHRRHAAQHRGRDPWRDSRSSQSASSQSGARLRKRRRVHEVLVQGGRRPTRSVRAGRRRLHPQREDQERRLLGRAGHRQENRPADHHLRMDRPAGAQGAGGGRDAEPARPTAESTPCRAIQPAAMGLADYLGWDWKSKAGLPIVNVPGCPVQPDNFMETLLYLLYPGCRPGADDSAR